MTIPQFDLSCVVVEKKCGGQGLLGSPKDPESAGTVAGHRFIQSLRDRLLLFLFYYMHPDCLRDGVQRGPSHRVKGHIVS